MSAAALERALAAAGFPGGEREGERVFARLSAAGGEFTAQPTGAGWELTLCRAVRASDRQRAEWAARHPDAPLDLWQGETRLRLVVAAGDAAALARWAALAEALVVATTRWRKGQRDRGEGM